MHKIKHYWKQIAITSTLLVAIVVGLYVGVSIWLSAYIQPMITKYAAAQNIQVEIKRIKSYLPLRIECDRISYDWKDFGNIELKNVTLKTKLFFISKRTFHLDSFSAKTADIELYPSSKPQSEIVWPEPFLGLDIASIAISRISLIRPDSSMLVFSLDGSSSIAPRAASLNLKGKVEQISPYQEEIDFAFSGLKRTKFVSVNLKFQERSRGFVISYLKDAFPIEKGQLSISASGHLNHWSALFLKTPVEHAVLYPNIKGSAKGRITFRKDITLGLSPLFEKEAELSTKFAFVSNEDIEFSRFSTQSKDLKIEGNLEYNFVRSEIKKAGFLGKVGIHNPLFSKWRIQPSAPLHLSVELEGPLGGLNWQIDYKQKAATFKNIAISNLLGSLSLSGRDRKEGKGDLAVEINGNRGKLLFELMENNSYLSIRNIDFNSPMVRFRGRGLFSLPYKDITRLDLDGTVNQDELVKELLPKLSQEINFQRIDGNIIYEKDPMTKQAAAKIDFTVDQLASSFGKARLSSGSVIIDSLLASPKMNLNVTLSNGSLHHLPFDSLNLQTEYGSFENYYQVKIQQSDKSAFQLQTKGFWTQNQDKVVVNLSDFDTSIYDVKLALEKKARFEFDKTSYAISPTLMTSGEGFIFVTANNNKTQGLDIKFQNAPTGILSFFYPKFTASGTVTGDLTFQTKGGINAYTSLRFDKIKLRRSGWLLMDADFAAIDANFKNQQLSYLFDLRYKEQYFRGNGQLPITKQYGVDPNRSFKTEFHIDDKSTHLLEYLNAEGHAIRGDVRGDLVVTGTLHNPQLEGDLLFSEGSYENYDTGLLLQNVDCRLSGKNNRLILDKLTATDLKAGATEASGYVEFAYRKQFPFSLDIRFENITLLNIDNVSAAATGLVNWSGTIKDTTLKGKLNLSQGMVSLPDRIKNPIPVLPLTFVTPQQKEAPVVLFDSKMTVNFDFESDVLGTLRLRGRGLNSFWQGSFQAKGNMEKPELYGKFEYTQGAFKFAGRTFKLTQGEITFNGPVSTNTAINLQAEETLGDIIVTISIRGPLNAPILTLSSSPDLPISMILSRLLFNKDISEIDSFQAIKLAQTALELSSGDLGILEKIQASTGLDRLAITSAPSTAEGSDTPSEVDEELGNVAVQVGKYITKGVLITTTQGTTAEARSYSVEIDLKYNLILQLETNQQRDGKLSLKWNKSY